MNRSTKFRVWDNSKNEWFPIKGAMAFLLNNDGNENLVFITKAGPYPIPQTGQENGGRNRFSVQQFTGLKDKNGKEIYEGDIVKTIYVNDPVNDIGNIIYHVETGAYRIKTSKHLLPIVTYRFIEDKPQGLLQVADEIIGNIFENPELLK